MAEAETAALFEKMHLHHVTNHDHENHPKLLVFSSDDTPSTFQTIDCESPEAGLTASRPLPFYQPPPENLRGRYYPGGPSHVSVLASFAGLVCIEFQSSDLIMWNPLTGDYKKLSKPEEFYKLPGNLFGLYYSSFDDDYKLLCVTLGCDVYIYSLKSDTWRKNIDSSVQLKRINYVETKRWSPSWTQVNEKLYFINRINFLQTEAVHRLTHSVIKFDPNTEKFTAIPTPVPGNRYVKCLSHGGFLYLYVVETQGLMVELWRLDGGDGGWTNVLRSPVPNNRYASWARTHPVHLMRDGKWLTRDEGYFFKLDLARGTEDRLWWLYTRGSIPTEVKYNETLVSPNR